MTSATATEAAAPVEVPAPEVFQTTDLALWDGRPSLGGIWVASPDATNPERVKITNVATGESITGALFRREVFNPGPSLQLSSDAAEALGLVAGMPTQVSVVALRKAEAPDQIGADAVATLTALPAEPSATETPLQPQAEPNAAETPTVTAAPAATAKAAPPAASASAAMVQVAIFSVEQNARDTVAQLTGAGIDATIQPVTRSGKTLWVVNAAADGAAAELLAKVKALGFADAYVLQ